VKTQVFLVNFGAPKTADDVPLFLRSLTGHDAPPEAIDALKGRYRAIGGGSPLAAITEEQAALLSADTGLPVACAFRYASPTLEEAINGCYRSAAERIVFFIMSPYYNSRTVGAYLRTVEGYLPLLPYRPEVVFVHSWHGSPAFRQAWVERVRAHAAQEPGVKTGPGAVTDAFYIFSAHSLPLSCKDEPYAAQVQETVSDIAVRLGLPDSRYAVGWQSAPASSEEPWMGPSVEEVMESAAKGAQAIVEIPVGFVSDHLETLYDIDIVHAGRARSLGLAFRRVPSLNTYPPFMAALKAILLERIEAGSR
jgi:ferrochelatase